MKSTRLPGKILLKLSEKHSVLSLCVERAKKSKKANNGKERFSTGDIVESSKMQTEVDDKNDDDDEDDEDLFPSEMLNA